MDPEASLGEAAKSNPFRFEGFYQDSAIKSYDMQARPYRPEVGRFLTQDRYEESQGDFELQSDPLTQNRYAFAGGNPVNNVEWDGHHHCGAAQHETAACGSYVGAQRAAQTARTPQQRGAATLAQSREAQRQQVLRQGQQSRRQATQAHKREQGTAADRFGGIAKGLTGEHLFGDKNNAGFKKGEKYGSAAGWVAPGGSVGKANRPGRLLRVRTRLTTPRAGRAERRMERKPPLREQGGPVGQAIRRVSRNSPTMTRLRAMYVAGSRMSNATSERGIAREFAGHRGTSFPIVAVLKPARASTIAIAISTMSSCTGTRRGIRSRVDPAVEPKGV